MTGDPYVVKYSDVLGELQEDSLQSIQQVIGPVIWESMYGKHIPEITDAVPNAITLALRRSLDKISANLKWDRVAVEKSEELMTSLEKGKRRRTAGITAGAKTKKNTLKA